MSSKTFYPAWEEAPDIRNLGVMLKGAGAAIPTVLEGGGGAVTMARSGVGVYTLTLADTVVALVGACATVGADDPDAVKGFTCHTNGALTANNLITLKLYNAAQGAVDLASTEYISVALKLRDTSVTK